MEGFAEGKVHEDEGSKEGEEVELLDYGSTPEIEAIDGGTKSEVQGCNRLRSQVHVL